MSSLLSRKI